MRELNLLDKKYINAQYKAETLSHHLLKQDIDGFMLQEKPTKSFKRGLRNSMTKTQKEKPKV